MNFIGEDFLLKNETAKRLYYKYAENMPIIDYHCHINPQEIYENRKFENITQVWLEITGDSDDRTKFQRFAEMLPKAIGNPMYHWTHLELKRYFGYDGVLNGEYPDDEEQLGAMVRDICYNNAQRYFNI